MNDHITTNIYHRVFHIKVGASIGTAFTVEVDGKQYIITAKHLAELMTYPGSLEIFHDSNWKKINASLVGHGSGKRDVSVLATDFQLSPTFSLRVTKNEAVFSQDVFFLGFPLGIVSPDAQLNFNFPLPLVKKATLSGCMEIDGFNVDVLDGINNPGFSGGPVICVPPNKAQNDFQVIGVISGYRIQFENTVFNGQKTELLAPMNSGLIISYPITIAQELISSNPVGFPVQIES